jgi:hypothetical protein
LPVGGEVGAVPAQPSGESSFATELGDVLVDVAVVAQPLAEELPVVAHEQALGDVLELKEQRVPGLLPLLDGSPLRRARVPDGHGDQVVDALRMEGREQPRDDSSEVMADHMGALCPELVKDAEHVGHAVPDPVVLHRRRPAGLAAAAQVGRDRAQPSAGQRPHLIAPETVRVREPVQQKRGGPVPLLPNRKIDSGPGHPLHHGERSRYSPRGAR